MVQKEQPEKTKPKPNNLNSRSEWIRKEEQKKIKYSANLKILASWHQRTES